MFYANEQDSIRTQQSTQKNIWLESILRQSENTCTCSKVSRKHCRYTKLIKKGNTFVAKSEWIRSKYRKYVGWEIIWSVSRHCSGMCRFTWIKLVEKDDAVLEDEMGELTNSLCESNFPIVYIYLFIYFSDQYDICEI